jgi:multiple RNA-binding domain-containing protein 1
VNPTGENVAVRVTLAETQIINETKSYLEDEGVNVENLTNNKSARSSTIILVKNLPFSVTEFELLSVFQPFGSVSRFILPPARTIALIEFAEATEARKAFRSVAYTNFKGLPLYLEWAVIDIFQWDAEEAQKKKKQKEEENKKKRKLEETSNNNNNNNMEDESKNEDADDLSSTLYVKNLNWKTSEENLKTFFESTGLKVRSVRIAKKKDPSNPSKMLNMGYGFVEFQRREDAVKAMKTKQNQMLDEHALELKFSEKKGVGDHKERKERKELEKSPKLMVRNLAFEANQKELKELFRPFGQLKKIRIPKNFDSKSRGFAFVEFMTPQEASNAMEALQNSHFYGRHLVIEYAKPDASLEEIREKTAKDLDKIQGK